MSIMLNSIFILWIDGKKMFVELNEFFFKCMFNIGERESEKEEEKWVGDEIDAMKDNILFFLFSLEKEKFVERRKKNER